MTSSLIDRLLSDKTSPLHEEAADEIIRLQNEMRGMVRFERYRETAEENQRLRSEFRSKCQQKENAE